MKIFILLIGIVIIGIIAFYFLFPKNTFIMVPFSNKGDLVFSKKGIDFNQALKSVEVNGAEEIVPFISKLKVTSSDYKSILILLPEREEGFILSSRDGQLKISLSVTLTKQPEKENLIREYFKNINIQPVYDYLAQDNTIRIIDYNLSGTDNQITELIIDLLTNIFNYKDSEILNIQYNET